MRQRDMRMLSSVNRNRDDDGRASSAFVLTLTLNTNTPCSYAFVIDCFLIVAWSISLRILSLVMFVALVGYDHALLIP